MNRILFVDEHGETAVSVKLFPMGEEQEVAGDGFSGEDISIFLFSLTILDLGAENVSARGEDDGDLFNEELGFKVLVSSIR